MTTRNDERKAAEKAQAVVISLTPITPRTEAIMAVLRNASRVSTNAIQNFASQKGLDDTRGEVATALSGLCGAPEKPPTQAAIDRAKTAVEKWLSGLASLEHDKGATS